MIRSRSTAAFLRRPAPTGRSVSLSVLDFSIRMLETFFALGFIPGTVGSGLWLLDRVSPPGPTALHPLDRYSRGTALGLAAMLLLLAGLAWLDWYSPAVVGFLGWVLAALTRHRLTPGTGRFDRSQLLVLLGAVVLAIWSGRLATESILAGRDEGVYSNHAVHLARTGALRVAPTFQELFEPDYFSLAAEAQAGGYFFDIEEENIYLQFPPSFALFLAQAFGIGGYTGLFWFNPLLGALNVLLFFGVARRLLPVSWAGLGTVFFALVLPQFWIVRVTLSEVLTQTLLLAGLGLFFDGVKARHARSYLAAGALLALGTFVRIDAYLAVIAVAGAGAFLSLAAADAVDAPLRRMARWGSLLAWGIAVLALAYGRSTSPGYYADFMPKVGLMLGAAAGLTLLAWVPLPAEARNRVRNVLAYPVIGNALAVIVGGLVLYAWFLRPQLEPFAEFAPELGRTGRDYRENTVRDLAAYLSGPGLALGVAGYLMLLRALLKGRQLALAALLAVWTVAAGLYLYNPYISTDHIWKMRRYVPVVIPGFVLFATWAAAALAPRIAAPKLRQAAVALASCALLGFLGHRLTPLAARQIDAGAVQFVTEVANAIPRDALVVALNLPTPLFGPLQLAEQREAVRARRDRPAEMAQVRQLVNEAVARGREVRLVSPTPYTSEPADSAQFFYLDAPSLERTTRPPPRENVGRVLRAYVAPLHADFWGFAADAASVTIGSNPVLGVEESGFHATGYAGDRPVRWTSGNARLVLPNVFPAAPIKMTLQVLHGAPNGSPLQLLINGREVLMTDVPSLGGDFPLPVDPQVWAGSTVEFDLLAPSWKPSEIYPDSADSRDLGIELLGIEIQFHKPVISANYVFGSQQKAAVPESGLYRAESVKGVPARWTDGRAVFELNLAPTYTPRRLLIDLFAIPRAGTEVEIRWNGTVLTTEQVDTIPHRFELTLPDVRHDAPNQLEVINPPWVPAETEAGSTDTRQLGVMVGDIQLLR